MALHCHNCNTTIKRQVKDSIGCNCDPDAPTWLFLMADGSVLSQSQSNYTVTED